MGPRVATLTLLIACSCVALQSSVFAQTIQFDCYFDRGTVQMRWDGKTGEPEPQPAMSEGIHAYHYVIAVKPTAIRIDGANGVIVFADITITIIDYATPAKRYRAHRSSHAKLTSPKEGDYFQFENDGFCTVQ